MPVPVPHMGDAAMAETRLVATVGDALLGLESLGCCVVASEPGAGRRSSSAGGLKSDRGTVRDLEAGAGEALLALATATGTAAVRERAAFTCLGGAGA